MNKFTKEELQYMLYACERSPLEDSSVENKIQAMINNYCEHEWDNDCKHHWDSGCCGGALQDTECVKCGIKLVGDKTQ